MATFLYPSGKVALWRDLDLVADVIRGVPVSGDYAPDPSHATLSDVPLGARSASSVALTGRQVLVSDAVAAFAADPLTFPAVGGGGDIVGLVLYRESDGALIAFLDYFSNLPLTPDGRDVKFTFPTSGNYVFAY